MDNKFSFTFDYNVKAQELFELLDKYDLRIDKWVTYSSQGGNPIVTVIGLPMSILELREELGPNVEI